MTPTLTVLAQAPQDFAVLGGDDPYLFLMTLMGAAGAISASANLEMHRFVAMIDHGLAGEVAPGRKYTEALLPLVRALFAEPSPAVIKALLQRRRCNPYPRRAHAAVQRLRDRSQACAGSTATLKHSTAREVCEAPPEPLGTSGSMP